jgi:SAM-dependent methyltransferase
MSADPNAPSYFEDPTKYVRGNPYIEFRSRVVRELLSELHTASILDVGAGSGEVTIPLLQSDNKLVFVDSSQGMIDLAMRNVPLAHRERVQAVRAGVLDFAPSTRFDAVVCIGVLAHVAEWRPALHRLASWVAPGGTLILQFTDHAAVLGRLSHRVGRVSSALLGRARHCHQQMGFADIEETLAEVSFVVREARRHCFVPGLRILPGGVAKAVIRSTSEPAFARDHGGEVIAAFRRK